jgi:basic membrane protein A
LAPLGTFADKVPADLVAKVRQREQEMKDGMFRVNVNDTEPKPTM